MPQGVTIGTSSNVTPAVKMAFAGSMHWSVDSVFMCRRVLLTHVLRHSDRNRYCCTNRCPKQVPHSWNPSFCSKFGRCTTMGLRTRSVVAHWIGVDGTTMDAAADVLGVAYPNTSGRGPGMIRVLPSPPKSINAEPAQCPRVLKMFDTWRFSA
jgi:hypothetical protein